MTSSTSEYAQAKTSTFVVDRSELGMLKFTGETRTDLIHRMSTQDLRNMASGEGRATVLTTEIGRIIDRLILYASSDTVYALTGENNADNIARYLMRFVFFNDDFHIEDVSSKTAIFAVYGPDAAAKLSAAGFPETDLPLHHWRQVHQGDLTLYLHKADPLLGDGYFVMTGVDQKDEALKLLMGAGIEKISAETFEFLRIEAGMPRFGHELTNDYIPLETGLWDDVSFSKGCYIGQEIIARMESRGKLAKKLVRLQGDGTLPVGATVMASGKKAGTITSAKTVGEKSVAMAYLKTATLEKEDVILSAENITLKPIT